MSTPGKYLVQYPEIVQALQEQKIAINNVAQFEIDYLSDFYSGKVRVSLTLKSGARRQIALYGPIHYQISA